MDNLKIIFTTLSIFCLCSCASLNKDECLTIDWSSIGYEDGANGSHPQRIGKHRKACAKHGVSPDLQAYNQGREDGLKQYCQPANGYNKGLRGSAYNGVCIGYLEAEFLEAYQEGRHLYLLRNEVNKTQSQIVSRENRIHKLEYRVEEIESVLVNGDNTPEERQHLVDETKELSEEIGSLTSFVKNLHISLGKAQNELDRYYETHINIY